VLLNRFIQYSPRESDSIIRFFLSSLNHRDEDVSQSALQHSPELFLFCKEHTNFFLLQLFRLGKTAAPQLLQILNVKLENAKYVQR